MTRCESATRSAAKRHSRSSYRNRNYKSERIRRRHTPMTSAASVSNALRDLYAQEFVRIRQQFEATGDGSEAVRQRTVLLDNLIRRLWNELISPDPESPAGFAVVALGGYGRADR